MGAVQSVVGQKMRRRASALVLGLALAAASLVGTPAVAAETTLRTPVKIMPMGDSITHGAGATGGYRLELKDLLVPAGHSFDFVGSQSSGPYEMEDRQHQGHSGFRIDQIADIARDKVTTYRPDIVLLVIGTNDVGQDYALDSAPARLGGLIDTILDAAPAASVIVGSIPPFADPVDDAQVGSYNAAIPGVVQARADAGKKVSFVDMYGALTLADLYDGIHPNADGYFKMAQVWRTALQSILPPVPSTGTPSCPCSAWSAGQAPVVSQVSSTSPTEVGVRFRVEKYGYITGIRFYKGLQNTGTHKGSLWARDGRLLASATFTNETASGWQQVNFSSPVVVWPWTTYVASYFAPVGRYAADPGVFTQTEIVSSPVRLLAAGQSGGNGWAVGTSTGAFPSVASSQAANYWVDVVFSPSADPAPPPPPPSAPGSLRVTGTTSSQISLAWNDVIGETGFRVERAPGGTTNWTAVGVAARDIWVFTDTGLAASTTYKYRVIATSRNGDSAPSNVVTTATAALPVPVAPGGVSAVAVSSSQVDVGWQDVAGESGYRVERSADAISGWAQVGATGADVLSFSDTGLAASTGYWYRVVAFNGSGDSAPSAVVSATTMPATPAGVTAVAVSSSQVDVGWQDVAGESGYRVERSGNGVSGWAEVGTTGAGETAFSDTGLTASTTYFYRVLATNSAGDSAPSAAVNATTDAPPPPVTPAGVTAVAVSSSQVDVGWQDVAGESGYRVERSADGISGWAQVGATGADVLSFSDTGLTASTTYFYRVLATNSAGDSAPSAAASATTLATADIQPPTVPTKLKASVAKSKINLTWTGSTDSGSGVAGYRLYRSSTGLDGSFTLLTTTTSTSASVSAPSGVALWYRVTAYDAAGNESGPSSTVRAVAR